MRKVFIADFQNLVPGSQGSGGDAEDDLFHSVPVNGFGDEAAVAHDLDTADSGAELAGVIIDEADDLVVGPGVFVKFSEGTFFTNYSNLLPIDVKPDDYETYLRERLPGNASGGILIEIQVLSGEPLSMTKEQLAQLTEQSMSDLPISLSSKFEEA